MKLDTAIVVQFDEEYVPSKGRVYRALLALISLEDKAIMELYCKENNILPSNYVYGIYLKNKNALAPLFANDETGRRHDLITKDNLTREEEKELFILQRRQDIRRKNSGTS